MTAHLNRPFMFNQNHWNKKGPTHKNRSSFDRVPFQISDSSNAPIYVHQYSKISVENSVDSDECHSTCKHKSNFQNEEDSDESCHHVNTNSIQRKPLYSSFNFAKRQKYTPNTPITKSDMTNSGTAVQPKGSPSNKSKKYKMFHFDNNANINKLEETYWAKWKPKSQNAYRTNHKPKPLHNTSFTKTKSHGRSNKKSNKERGDSDETIVQIQAKRSIHTSTREEPEPPPEVPQSIEITQNNDPPLLLIQDCNNNNDSSDNTINSNNNGLRPLGTLPLEITPHIPQNYIESDYVKPLKHTDSFILHCKKRHEDKPHYQQPKCIKLFKNTTSGNYIRGGTYTLKSCLKTGKTAATKGGNVQLGQPGSPIKITLKQKK